MPGEQKTERIIDRIGLSWLPMLSFQSAIVLLTTFYLIALSHNQLEAKLAFISDTGAQPPASCWFSLLMNFTAFCFVAVVIARFIGSGLFLKNRLVLLNNNMMLIYEGDP